MVILTILTMDFQMNMQKNLKLEKNPYKFALLLIDWWWFKFNVISLSFDRPLKTVKLKPL
jgi:hypothetical protein